MKDGTRHNTLIFLDDGKYDLFIFIGLKEKKPLKAKFSKMLIMDILNLYLRHTYWDAVFLGLVSYDSLLWINVFNS